jgi:hypothetical protein
MRKGRHRRECERRVMTIVVQPSVPPAMANVFSLRMDRCLLMLLDGFGRPNDAIEKSYRRPAGTRRPAAAVAGGGSVMWCC